MSQNDNWTLSGKHALVTGGSKGIGAAIVKEFVRHGASVMTVARNEKQLIEFCRQPEFAGKVTGLVADVSQTEGLQNVINPDSALETKFTNAEGVGLWVSIRVNPDKRKVYQSVGRFSDFIA